MDFNKLYEEYWNKIYRLCMGYINDHDQAKDLAQETFITVWEKLSTFRNEASIGTWIFRIATNTCLSQIKKNEKLSKAEILVADEDNDNPELDQEIKLLYQFISELAELDRIIISLELEGIKQQEISKIVGLSDANIRVKIHRIKEKLNTKFKNHGK
ncbi:DNA-directed RNA polymerase sigma-70 factor [Sphingobacterium mizutaii NBRC 14946 = DSM 11724]|uniref:Sigma-24 n=2 Tax=Sphingobacterium mizutaii TaxID=1010 RepID=A0AAJ5C0J4_9SPHI|nr:sigma-70 family RNA polymerase sigma factor [Sphingobacterium mizutaii]GEM68169.1 DNA-directed RNA polymerase sigma-70 factor [Sphingobacterium mizutaii NBRC 14946 = DSM 11724]SDL08860.1 RNA polymerase sigma-70 factor, ECF subfamily [Sphingobacterium mizutaii]SNV51291.1 Sigma-24 [Sphingobacterium mizutaii]